MVIFTARQNLANLNEVKMNLIVKFANLAGKSYSTWKCAPLKSCRTLKTYGVEVVS